MAVDWGICTATGFIWAKSTQGQPQVETRSWDRILLRSSQHHCLGKYVTWGLPTTPSKGNFFSKVFFKSGQSLIKVPVQPYKQLQFSCIFREKWNYFTNWNWDSFSWCGTAATSLLSACGTEKRRKHINLTINLQTGKGKNILSILSAA